MKRVTYAEGGSASDSDSGDDGKSMASSTKAEEEENSSSDGKEGSGVSEAAKACYARVFKSATGLVTILSWAAVLQVSFSTSFTVRLTFNPVQDG